MVTIPDQTELRNRMRLESRDVRLLQLLFSREVSGDEKTAFCEGLDIEKESMEFNLMLAHLCHRHGYQGIPLAIQPRIRGAARFYLFKNGALFSSFRLLGRSLNQAGIPILLLKGAAVKAVYDADASRCLIDIDFAVPKQLLQAAVQLAEQQGYCIRNRTHHSVDMKQSGLNSGSIDIHCRLLKMCNSRCLEDELADGAKEIEAFGVRGWVSSPENLLLQLLENEFFNLCTSGEHRRRFKWIYDCGRVLAATPEFDWSRVARVAKKYGLYNPIRSMLTLLRDHLPQYLPDFHGHFPEGEIRYDIDPYIATVLKWRSQEAHRVKLSAEGKRWRSLFLRPFQMATEYRFLQMDKTVNTLREFLLTHCRANNYSEAAAWVFEKLRRWKKGSQARARD